MSGRGVVEGDGREGALLGKLIKSFNVTTVRQVKF